MPVVLGLGENLGGGVSQVSTEKVQHPTENLHRGTTSRVRSQMEVNIQYEDQEATLPLLIVPGKGPPLWGRNWLTSIRLHWRDIKKVSPVVEPLLDKYSSLFSEELGTLKDVQVKLSVSKDAVPKFTRPQLVPYALRGAIDRDLKCLGLLRRRRSATGLPRL